jgi:hypothetical protein
MRTCRAAVNFFFAIIRAEPIEKALMKQIRQKAILDLVRSKEIASQEELLEGLLERKSTMNGEPFCPSSKKYCIVMIDQIPPASNFSYFLM